MHGIDEGRLPKDILYSELAVGMRSTWRALLRYSDACGRDMQRGGVDVGDWESIASDRSAWSQLVNKSKNAVET